MARKAIALTVGVNELLPSSYPGVAPLAGCEDDAHRVAELAEDAGFEVRGPLLSSAATRQAFNDAVTGIASELTGDRDIFLLHFAGHGSQWPDDVLGVPTHDENDGRDETICLYDGQLVDDELLRLWAHFGPGVRILFLVDCCHSGSMIRGLVTRSPVDVERRSSAARGLNSRGAATADRGPGVDRGVAGLVRDRILSDREAERSFNALADFYQHDIRDELRRRPRLVLDDMLCGILTITACEDHETAKEEGSAGVFTRALTDVWDNGAFRGSYETFCDAIRARIQSRYQQSPRILVGGDGGLTVSFQRQTPFEI